MKSIENQLKSIENLWRSFSFACRLQPCTSQLMPCQIPQLEDRRPICPTSATSSSNGNTKGFVVFELTHDDFSNEKLPFWGIRCLLNYSLTKPKTAGNSFFFGCFPHLSLPLWVHDPPFSLARPVSACHWFQMHAASDCSFP